jgi:hypothetical protein
LLRFIGRMVGVGDWLGEVAFDCSAHEDGGRVKDNDVGQSIRGRHRRGGISVRRGRSRWPREIVQSARFSVLVGDGERARSTVAVKRKSVMPAR